MAVHAHTPARKVYAVVHFAHIHSLGQPGRRDENKVTRHTSLVTRHTSHVTRHTSHITRHASRFTNHTPHVTHSNPPVIPPWRIRLQPVHLHQGSHVTAEQTPERRRHTHFHHAYLGHTINPRPYDTLVLCSNDSGFVYTVECRVHKGFVMPMTHFASAPSADERTNKLAMVRHIAEHVSATEAVRARLGVEATGIPARDA